MTNKMIYIKRTKPLPTKPIKDKAIVEQSVMENLNLAVEAKGLYSYIQGEITEKNSAYLDIKKTCKEMVLSEIEFYKYLKELVDEDIYAI